MVWICFYQNSSRNKSTNFLNFEYFSPRYFWQKWVPNSFSPKLRWGFTECWFRISHVVCSIGTIPYVMIDWLIDWMIDQVPGRPVPPAKGTEDERRTAKRTGPLPQRILPGTVLYPRTYLYYYPPPSSATLKIGFFSCFGPFFFLHLKLLGYNTAVFLFLPSSPKLFSRRTGKSPSHLFWDHAGIFFLYLSFFLPLSWMHKFFPSPSACLLFVDVVASDLVWLSRLGINTTKFFTSILHQQMISLDSASPPPFRWGLCFQKEFF